MKTVTSVSGGKSSAYIAANYPSDFLVFALVCIEDRACTPKDAKLVQMVSDRIGREFIATAEDDTILHTMFDLEQYLGQKIDWVAGESFDFVTEKRGGWLPNKLHRYCTVEMKLRPMFRWWKNKISEPVYMQIGFRAGEEKRALRMMERQNGNGLLEFKDVIGKHSNGNNKWADMAWQHPIFPMIDDGIHRDRVVEFWKDKPVRFAERNNCVGCFHRNPLLLRQMFDKHPDKMEWFASRERRENRGSWRSDMTYDEIKRHKLQFQLDFDDFSECDSGHCGL
jgi:hypothetical protein